jgi:hypothetical protein
MGVGDHHCFEHVRKHILFVKSFENIVFQLYEEKERPVTQYKEV